MIFTFRNKIWTLTNKTSLLLVNIVFSLCFYPFVSVRGYSKIDSEIKNPKIFKLCENLDLFVSESIASDNEIIIVRSNGKVIGIDSFSFLKIWDYEIPGEFLSEPRIESKKLILETIETAEKGEVTRNKEEITDNRVAEISYVQVTVTIINLNTGIPLEVKKIKVSKDYYDKSGTDYRKSVNLAQADNSDIIEENNDSAISRKIGNNVFLGYKNGEIILLSKLTQLPVWKTKVGGEVTNITVLNRGIIINSKDNFLYFLDFKNGNKIWKKRMSGRILKVLIIDSNLAGIIDSNSKTVHLININSGNDAGTLLQKDDQSEIFEIKKYSEDHLILLSMSGISLYSDSKCKNQKV